MPRLPQDFDATDPDISYEFVSDFDEMLEIDEIEDDPMSAATTELADWKGPHAID